MAIQLHPQYETLFLLCNTPWGQEEREKMITELDKMGFEGEVFYQKHFRIVEQYYQTFCKNRIESRGTELLCDMDEGLVIIYTVLFEQHPDWYEDLSAVSEEVVAEAVEDVLISGEEGIRDIIAALELAEISDESKWKIIKFRQHAKQQLGDVAAAIKENIPAFEKARNKIEKRLNILLKQFCKNINKAEKAALYKIPEKIIPDGEIIPTLAFPMAVFVNSRTCFYGLLSDQIAMGKEAKLTREGLLVGAKALSDKSKLEILLCLKEKRLCNFEIAERVGLTPATVSHHMGTLLAAGFVELSKEGGRGCYTLSRQDVEYFLQGMRQLLLTGQ